MASLTTLSSYRPVARRANQLENRRTGPQSTHEKLALVIPALREAENIEATVNRVRAVLAGLEIPSEVLVVDDDSRDGTAEIVSAIARQDPRVRLLVRNGESGLSGAILHGWQHTDATILGVMDADGQHPAEVLSDLVAAIRDGRDLAIGSRYANGGRGCAWNLLRRLISKAAIWAASPLQPGRLRVSDPLSGFFLVRRRCIERVLFQPAGFKLLLEILVRGRLQSVEEVPFAFARRRAGCSKVSLKVAWDYLALLARLYRARFAIARVPQPASGD